MPIPDFCEKGHLPDGIHTCSGTEFINRFCTGEIRKKYHKPVCDLFDFAKHNGADELFIGGSYITSALEPNDLDCVIVFSKDQYIPRNIEKIFISGLKIDVLYASKESRDLVDTYLKLFSTSRKGTINGIIQVALYSNTEKWQILHEPDDGVLEIVKRVYNDRSLIDLRKPEGILVSIHGLFSTAKWNMEISPVASSQGWIFAPYVYEENWPDLLVREDKRRKVVDDFRKWVYELQTKYDANVSVIAHSFGTYIIGAYLSGFDPAEFPPVSFNSIILTGSIIHKDFDWESMRGRCIGSVYNMIAPNDQWVKMLPDGMLGKVLNMSDVFGKSGLEGFNKKSDILKESTNSIFDHNNTIKTDIIETKWMPFLRMHKESLHFESTKYILAQNKRPNE